MKWSEFINKARTDIHQHESEVDPMAIWSAIESDVDSINTKRKKKRIFIWFSLLGVSALGLFLCWNILFNTNPRLTSSDLTDEMIVPVNKTRDQNEAQSSPTLQQPTIASKSQQGNSLTETETFNANQNRANTDNAVSKVISKNKTIEATPTQSSKSSNEIIFQKDLIKNQSTLNKKSALDQIIQSSNIVTAAPGQFSNSNTDQNNTHTIKSTMPISLANENIGQFNKNENNKSIQSDHWQESENDVINPLGLLNTRTLDHETPFKITSVVNPPVNPRKQTQQESAFKLGLSLEGGFGFSSKKLTEKSPSNSTYLEERENTETRLETSQYGMAFIAAHRSGFELSLGIHQTNMIERFDYQDAQVSYDTLQGITYYRIDLNGNKQAVMGDVVSTETRLINKKIYNRYKMLELPVIVGYRHGMGKWTTGVHIGMLANISLKTSGQIMDVGDKFIDIDNHQEDVFKSNLGFGYYVGVSVGCHITPKLLLSINPQVRGYAQSITQASYGLEQKHKTIGAQVGITYWLK